LNKISIFSYKQIIKNISILGLVQIIIILVSIFRSKFIALTLGPIGFGLSGMFIYTINMISSATNFGLSSSAVRDISAAYESKNSNRISIITVVLSRLVLITGILGMIILVSVIIIILKHIYFYL
jgi:O-antigen/teichoic acid export membrane protein